MFGLMKRASRRLRDILQAEGASGGAAVRRYRASILQLHVDAAAELRRSGFPLDEMTAILATQSQRESRAFSRATEMVFSHGAQELQSIGRRFGYLVYVLDAWEDRARDAKSGDFNALAAFPAVEGRAEILSVVESLEKDLPPHLAVRLRTNVEEKLGMRMRVLHGACKESSKDRWRSAVVFARSMKVREQAGFMKGAAVLATVSVLAFFAPHHIRGAESWRQCFGLVMNLMAVGAIFATVPVPETPGSPEKKSSKYSGCCDCDGCDGCCECGACCECVSCCDC